MSKFKSWVDLRRKVNWVLHPPTCGCVYSYLDLQYVVDSNDLLSFTNYFQCLFPINFCNRKYCLNISQLVRSTKCSDADQKWIFMSEEPWHQKTIYMISVSHPYVKLCKKYQRKCFMPDSSCLAASFQSHKYSVTTCVMEIG